jgi:hypothetical protein
MGADFLLGAAELPPDDLSLDLLGSRLSTLLLDDPDLGDCLTETLGLVIATTGELVSLLRAALEEFRSGAFERQTAVLETFTGYGRPQRLTVSGHHSWGDTPEVVDLLALLEVLPDQWWVSEGAPTAPGGDLDAPVAPTAGTRQASPEGPQ